MTEPPRLMRARALELQRSVVLLSPQQAREEARGRANEREADRRLVDNLRGVADLHGWPNPIDRAGERVDRAWSHALVQHLDITPLVAADESVWSSLALVAAPDLVRWRFPEPGVERYVGVADHAFGRLWWRAFVLGEDLIDGLGSEPFTEDELVALFRRRDLVANPAVAQVVAAAVLRSAVSGPPRLALVKHVTLELLRLTPMIELDALAPEDLERLVGRLVETGIELGRGPVPSSDGHTPS
jgi:hypothetical protein